MNKSKHDKQYWQERYLQNEAGWDLGQVSKPLKDYIDQLTDKQMKVLIPGCGNAYEAQYMHEQGFSNVYVIDLVDEVLDNLKRRVPDYLHNHLICGDFFTHQGQYDLVLEQTFISSLEPRLRLDYVKKAYDLLAPGGRLAGVLFDFDLDTGPPYGGSAAEYTSLFSQHFKIKTLMDCYNSIESRHGIELFFILDKNPV